MVHYSTGSQVYQAVLVERYFSAATPRRLAQLALHTQAVAAREAADGVRWDIAFPLLAAPSSNETVDQPSEQKQPPPSPVRPGASPEPTPV